MIRTGLAVLLAMSSVCAAEPVRVALVHGSYGDFRHRDDYDGVMTQLGWKLDKFENKDFGKLAAQLDNYDLILGTALFNYSQDVQDFSVYKDQLQGFMQRGGAIVFTDCNYPDHVNWLGQWGADWRVDVQNCATNPTPNKWFDRSHPIFTAATPIGAMGASWSHMTPGSGWEALAKCSDDGANALFRSCGRGYMLLTSFWPHGNAQLRNDWATLKYTRAGLLPHLPDLTRLTFGDNALAGSFKNLTDQPLTMQMRLGLSAPGGDTPQFTTEAAAAPGQVADLKVNVPLPKRGQYDVSLTLVVKGGAEFPPAQATTRIPQLIEVEILEPRYRGAIMLAAPPKRVKARVTLHPFGEKLAGTFAVLRLWQGTASLGTSLAKPVTGNELELQVPLARLPRSDCELEVALLSTKQGKTLFSTRTKLPVVPARRGQVLIDEDLNTRLEGKLFFPITVYHVPVKDFAHMKQLGFNSLQAWGTNEQNARENLDAAQAVGLKVILEGTTHLANSGKFDTLEPMIRMFKSHPALLSWYLTDEPSGDERLAWCKRVYEYLQRQDPDHPVYLTSCSPGEFARYAWVTDIFAVDPYPIPAAPVTMVSNWMKTAQDAVQGRKPVWLIPQLHNWEAYGGHPENGRYPTPEEERNMVYQGLVWGAKGIFYYPWDDGCTGLNKDAKLEAAVKQINAELAQLGPELLSMERTLTAANDDAHPGLYAATYRGREGAIVIAVSVAKEAQRLSVPAPAGAATAEVLFEGRQVAVAGGQIADEFAPLAVHVYRVPTAAR